MGETECRQCNFYAVRSSLYPCSDCVDYDKFKAKEEEQDNVNSPEPGIAYLISLECSDIGQFLAKKNKAYGNSVIEPVRIFSKANTEEQFNVRIDDKLSRIMRGKEYEDEDTELDLIGYLIMKRVYRKWSKE